LQTGELKDPCKEKEKNMETLRIEAPWTIIETMGRKAYASIEKGDDITWVYYHTASSETTVRPELVTVVEILADRPTVQFEFRSTADAWEWWKETLGVGDDAIDSEEFELARIMAG
jgi:hypothetical protein